MFKPSLGLGTKLGAAANKSDLNVSVFLKLGHFFWNFSENTDT